MRIGYLRGISRSTNWPLLIPFQNVAALLVALISGHCSPYSSESPLANHTLIASRPRVNAAPIVDSPLLESGKKLLSFRSIELRGNNPVVQLQYDAK